MRIVSIGTVLLVGLVLAGCKSDRGHDPRPTTTTGADMPAVQRDLAPPAVIAPSVDIPAPPATESTPMIDLPMIDLDAPPVAGASPATRDDASETRDNDTPAPTPRSKPLESTRDLDN